MTTATNPLNIVKPIYMANRQPKLISLETRKQRRHRCSLCVAGRRRNYLVLERSKVQIRGIRRWRETCNRISRETAVAVTVSAASGIFLGSALKNSSVRRGHAAVFPTQASFV